tara:strand:- start:462 stop:647 length:186 start_codon:yes stop_codon:yes gene_type:complete
MTAQQEHLKNLINQYNDLSREIKDKRETLLKVQGAIEYLNQIGVNLEEEPKEDPVEESTEE